jgi:DNA polymerase alpha subunit A
MILTPYTEFNIAKKLGNEIIGHINKMNKYLKLAIDGLYRKILLLEKKKYIAILHTEDSREKTGK